MRRRYMPNVLSCRSPSSDRTAGDAVHNCSHIARPLLLATIALSTGFAGAEARIESFSPTGHSKSVRQVAVRFSEPMVALGDPSRTDPFGIDCEVPGRGRWVDERNWVYDFEYEMPGAVRCRFGLRDGLETLSGVRVQSPTEYALHTGGPSILAHQPEVRRKIDERQVFLLLLDAAADPDSIRQHARCRVADSVEEHPVDLVEGAERTEILEALSRYYYLSVLLRTAENHLPQGVDDKTHRRAIERIVTVRCLDPLPSGSDMELIWGTGIAAPNGLATLQDQTMAFSVRPSPRAFFGCMDTFKGRCVGRVHLAFSDPIPRESAARVRLTDPDGTILPGEIAETMQIDRIDYPGASVEDTTYRAALVGPIRDIYDRPLANASNFPATIRMGRWPPGANFGRAPIVVEYDEDATAPVLLRRIAQPLAGSRLHVQDDAEIVAWMRRVAGAWNAKPDAWRGLASSRPLFRPGDRAQRFGLPVNTADEPFQFASVPLAGRGFHVLQLDLPASPDFPARYVAGMALATNSAIHFHRAEESSLAWVTRLADGRPVDGAEVRVSAACTGRMLARGATDADGIARIPTALAWVDDCAGFRYLVTARKDGDLALATFGLPRDTEPRPTILFHTILDRSLYRPGETVSMKVILRRASSDGFALPAGLPAPGRVVIEHVPTGKQREIAIDFAADGSAVATFELPLDTRLGRYALSVEFAGHESPFSYLRVEQFRLGAMRASVDGPDKPVVNPRSVPVNLSVEHLAGGGAAALPVTVRWVVRQRGYYWESTPPAPESVTMSAILDVAGKATVDVPTPPLDRRAMLDVEMDYQDANGQRRTASSYFELWPAEVQLRITGHETPAGVRLVRLAVRDSDDAPVPDVAVQAKVYQPRNVLLRRLPGGFTGRGASDRVKTPLMATCSGATDANGTVDCELPPEAPSSAFVEATAHDAEGNEATAAGAAYFRIDDPGPAFLEVDSGRVFDVGDAVPVQVNLPYAEAMALVTVQREGLPTAFVTRMSGPKATVEVPVKKHYAPNFDVSVLAIPTGSNMVGDPRSVVADTVDVRHSKRSADRPDFRHGKVSVRVNPEPYALTVRVEPHRDRYRPRQRARVSITVLGPAGLPAPDVDLALVAVDEAVLELWPNRTWDLLDTMTQWRSARVDTTTSLVNLSPTLSFDELVPEPEFVMVSAPGAGPYGWDENADPVLRQRFEPTLLWRGRVALGEGGAVEVDVPLNDSLTSFRIVAIAAAGDDLFGTGEATIRTTQDLILHAGLPEVVREGDRFRASFTVRNASDVRRRVDVAAEIEGIGVLPRKRLRLRPGRSREVAWPVTVPAGVGRMAWEVTARSGSAVDRLAARQLVEPIVPVRVQQAILTQLATLRELPVKPPAKALPGRGGIRVSLQPSLAGSLHTVQEAMARYRYTCLEQKVSAAVVLDDPVRWSAAMAVARTSLDGDGLLRFFPSDSLSGSPILTAYVLAIADAAGNAIPDDLRDAMIEGLKEYVAGRITRVGVLGAADSHLRRLSALAALAPYDALDDDMVATVTEHQLEVLPTSALLDLIDIVEHLDPDRSELAFAKATLRSRLSLQGTTMGFSTENRDRLWWLMVSTDGNAARSILSLMGDAEWQQDLPRMMRGLFGRQQRGRWQTTVANAWGTVAAAKFATAFEPVAVTGASVVRLGEERRRAAWPNRDDRTASADAPPPIQLPWSAAQVLSLAHEGTGAPWGLVELRAAVPLTQPVSRGYRIARRMEPVDPAKRRAWARGGVAQIILDIDATADMTWVVVEDPLPPGTVVLGSGLGGDSSLLAARHKSVDRWPVFTERDVDSYRAYYRYVPKGRTTLRYNVRYNTAGRFQLPPTRIEAMYAPEMHAEMPLKPITIR